MKWIQTPLGFVQGQSLWWYPAFPSSQVVRGGPPREVRYHLCPPSITRPCGGPVKKGVLKSHFSSKPRKDMDKFPATNQKTNPLHALFLNGLTIDTKRYILTQDLHLFWSTTEANWSGASFWIQQEDMSKDSQRFRLTATQHHHHLPLKQMMQSLLLTVPGLSHRLSC